MHNNRFITTTRPNGQLTKKKERAEVTVIILGAMPIHRMKIRGAVPLIKHDDKQLFEHISESVNKAFPKNEIIATVGFQLNKVLKELPDNIRVVENQLYEETNLIEELRLALNNVTTDKVLVINGSCLIGPNSLKQIDKNKSSIIVENNGLLDKNDVGVVLNKGKVKNFAYGIENKWCEVFYLLDKEIKLLKNIVSHPDRKRWFLFEVLNLMLKRSGKLVAVEPENLEFTKIGK